MVLRLFLLAGALGLVSGCAYDNAEELFPAPACNTTAVTYQGTIAPILQANCLSCHSSSTAEGGIVLEEAHEVQHLAEHGTLLGVVTHAPGFPAMPKDAPQLSACDIAAIRAWVDAGAPDN